MNTDSTDTNSIGKINRRRKRRVLPPEFEGKVRLNNRGKWVRIGPTPDRISYPQNWPQYNRAQTQEKLLFYQILSDSVDSLGIEEKFGARGRPYNLMGDMLKACVIKVFVGLSSRRTISELKLVQKMGYIRKVPHYNSIVNYLNSKETEEHLNVLYRKLALPLKGVEKKFAVDATGFSTSLKAFWSTERMRQRLNKKIEYRLWRKLHIVTGVSSNIITSAAVTDGKSHDSPQFEGLVKDTSRSFEISELSADAGYISHDNVKLVSNLGGTPYIMPRSNTSYRQIRDPEWKRMLILWRDNKEEFKRHYHLRSNVESTFSMMKRKFSDKLRSRKVQAQTNEILCKVVCHNISVLVSGIFELGLELNFNS